MRYILLDIQKVVCAHYGVTLDAIHLGVRTAKIARARHMAMLMIRQHSDKSLAVIAELFDMTEPGALYAYRRASSYAELPEVSAKVKADLEKTSAKIAAATPVG